eukprot:3446704-Ditylum_brightwellii.AAC.1
MYEEVTNGLSFKTCWTILDNNESSSNKFVFVKDASDDDVSDDDASHISSSDADYFIDSKHVTK